jgi:hypothetical protein
MQIQIERGRTFMGGLLLKNIVHVVDGLSDQELSKLLSNTDIAESIDDNLIIRNKKLQKLYPILNVSRQKLNRILVRMLDNKEHEFVENLSLKDINVNVRQIRVLLKRYPEMVLKFNIDLCALSDDDAYIILRSGNHDILKKVGIEKRRFSTLMQYHISRAFNFSIDILSKMNTREFDGFQIREALKVIGPDHINLFNMNNMKMVDWVDISGSKRADELIKFFDIERYRDEPIRWFVDMAISSNREEIYEEIRNNRDLSELSAYEWKRLVDAKPEKFLNVCDRSKYDPTKS